MNNPNSSWWFSRIRGAGSLADLRDAMHFIAQRIGFRYFVFRGLYPQLLKEEHEIRMDNCPGNWLDHCSRAVPSAAQDPMHHRAMQEATPILWREWMAHYPDHFAAARKFGLVTGVTHPVHGPLGDRSSISFIKGVGGVQAEREISATLPESQLIGCYAHQAVARVVEKRFPPEHADSRPAVAAPSLTARERECLSWVATGKTAAEVATMLALSEPTIIYHLAKARRKLAATNSRHAVSKAISLKLIAPG